MATKYPIPRIPLTETEVIRIVAQNFRTCGYLFNTAAVWMGLGGITIIFAIGYQDRDITTAALVLEMIGAAIFTVAFAMTLALYRCPVCNAFIRRFRRNKDLCQSCGTRIRAAKQ